MQGKLFSIEFYHSIYSLLSFFPDCEYLFSFLLNFIL